MFIDFIGHLLHINATKYNHMARIYEPKYPFSPYENTYRSLLKTNKLSINKDLLALALAHALFICTYFFPNITRQRIMQIIYAISLVERMVINPVF